jgi:hypothetical protein
MKAKIDNGLINFSRQDAKRAKNSSALRRKLTAQGGYLGVLCVFARVSLDTF